MKRIALALAVFVSLMIPSKPSFAEWVKVGTSSEADHYIDTKIRQSSGPIYYWAMSDYIKPTKWGNLSIKIYSEGECTKFRVRPLKIIFYEQPMGDGPGDAVSPSGENKDWLYPPPGSINEDVLEYACKWAKTP